MELKVLSASEQEQVHRTSLDILETVGIEICLEEALALYQQGGAEVKGDRVYIRSSLVGAALAKAPRSFLLKARNPVNNVQIGMAEPVCAPPAGCVYISNYGEERRLASGDDYVALLKLLQVSGFYRTNGGGVVIPDLGLGIGQVEKYAWMVLAGHWYSDKPQMGFTVDAAIARECINISEIVFGAEPGCRVVGIINPDSPLRYPKEMLQSLLLFARAGQPLVFAPCSMAMTTSPATLAGTLALNNAEVLAGIVLAQLVNPGNPVVYGNTSTISDMQTMSIAIGAPELSLLAGAAAEMASFYHVPSRVGGALTDAKKTDYQAGMESMLSMLTALSSGASLVVHSGGIVDSFLTLSFEKLLLDEDLGGMASRISRGIEVNPESLALNVITEVGPGKDFLSTSHTLHHFRNEIFRPGVSDRHTFQAGRDYSNYLLDRARQEWRRRLASFQRPVLNPEIEVNLLEYYQRKFGRVLHLS